MTGVPDLPAHWPHRDHSHSIQAAGQRWHVQDMGQGPILLLIHGAGGALHGWRDLAPLLAAQYRVIALDVAGHGFSQKSASTRAGLMDIAQDIADLAAGQGWTAAGIIGHSAGAAIALALAEILPRSLPAAAPPLRAVIGLNAALSPFEGVAGWLFPAMAKTLSLLPFAPVLASRFLGQPSQIDRLLAQTGARIGPEGRAQYLCLARRPAHVAATLDMMAAWDLRPLLARLPQITCPVLLLTGGRDGAVPPRVSHDAAAALPNGRAQTLPAFGHLLPEEAAPVIAPMILQFLQQAQQTEANRVFQHPIPRP